MEGDENAPVEDEDGDGNEEEEDSEGKDKRGICEE
jgi:hypothetical protein